MRRKRSNRPTMDDVAALAGVSQMTVSRVINRKGYVSKEVRDKVVSASEQLGYVQNRLADALRNETASLIAVVLPTLHNRVFSEVLSGINDAAEAYEYQTVFGVTEYAPEKEERLVRDLLSWLPRGLILAGLEHTDNTIRAVRASGVNVVEVMDIDGAPLSHAIGLSHMAAGRTMAAHLLSRGYRRIAYLGSQGGLDQRAAKRLEGFRQVLSQSGCNLINVRVSDHPSSMQEGRRLTGELLAGGERPDAIYYSNDDLAAGGLMHCLANGLSVPEDVAIAGFNGLSFLESLPIRITTIETPRYGIGKLAVDSLERQGTYGTARKAASFTDLGFNLVIGQTT